MFDSPAFKEFASAARLSVENDVYPAEMRLQRVLHTVASKLDSIHQTVEHSYSNVNLDVSNLSGELQRVSGSLNRILSGLSYFASSLQDDGFTPTSAHMDTPPELSTVAESGKPNAPRYSMCRGIHTVLGLWREWTIGFNGGPSVEALERTWVAQWCTSSERRFYNRSSERLRLFLCSSCSKYRVVRIAGKHMWTGQMCLSMATITDHTRAGRTRR